jgi:hypothetical protein
LYTAEARFIPSSQISSNVILGFIPINLSIKLSSHLKYDSFKKLSNNLAFFSLHAAKTLNKSFIVDSRFAHLTILGGNSSLKCVDAVTVTINFDVMCNKNLRTTNYIYKT